MRMPREGLLYNDIILSNNTKELRVVGARIRSLAMKYGMIKTCDRGHMATFNIISSYKNFLRTS